VTASLRASSSSKRLRVLLDSSGVAGMCVENMLMDHADGHRLQTVMPQLAAFPKSTMRAKNGRTRRSFFSAFLVRGCTPSQGIQHADCFITGAFTPGCQARHLPPYIEKLSDFKSKGVDVVATIASNDSWVMNAWGKVNGVKGDDILFLSDTKTFFSKEHGWQAGMGDRNGRWAMVFDHGKVTYAENEPSPKDVSVSASNPDIIVFV
jgi:peroxiredoxin